MRTIRVTGKGQIKVKPDITRITMTLTGVFKEYSETLRHSSENTEALKDVLSAFGFERSDLKTLSFHVDTEYESYRDKNNDYKRRFVGYQFNHALKVEFESDNDRLGKILYALANGKVRPEFRISYTVKDPEAAKNLLLGKAVTDAKAGKIEYRLDKTNIIHCPIGKVSFGAEKLSENFNAIMGAIVKAKPAAAKGQYIKSCVVASTMGPGVKVNGAKLM